MDRAALNSDAEHWSQRLRERFLEVTAHRVPAAEVEDLVQEAMTTVLSRAQQIESERLVEGLPPLAWCFQVLRNTIGNFYQRHARAKQESELAELKGLHAEGTPAEALEQKELLESLREALEELRADDRQCWGFLSRLADGEKPRRLAEAAGLSEAVLYRRLYRCRQKFRRLLQERGVRV